MAKQNTKYIFVTGGVLSGLGKGITSASLGTILKARGFLINLQKCDPYLNTDAGTLNPAEHGEVFVTKDGAETDLDLGHYERFVDRELTKTSSLMSGVVYSKVINNERDGKYLGKTVQIIPHVTGEIQNEIIEAAKGSDIHIVEIGGTIGDYESLSFMEAIRQIRHRVGEENVLYVHVVFLPYLSTSKESKTKPAQNSVRSLREVGISPDIICVRSDYPISKAAIAKLSLYTDVSQQAIVPLKTAKTVYEVPLDLEDTGIGDYIVKRLSLGKKKANLTSWSRLTNQIKQAKGNLNIGIIAKYMDHEDTYMSVFEALKAAGWHWGRNINIVWVNSENLEKDLSPLEKLDGIVIPGGFGNRGTEGKILAAKYARENNVPYFGLCLGMQIAVIEFAREVLKTKDVNSTELDPKTHNPVIDLMPDQVGVKLGGSMRLGNYPATLNKKSISYKSYKKLKILERHRHRYEFNNDYRDILSKAGMLIAGLSPNKKLVEIVEIKDHPFFVGTQFHPEFKSRPNNPHPLFKSFVLACIKNK